MLPRPDLPPARGASRSLRAARALRALTPPRRSPGGGSGSTAEYSLRLASSQLITARVSSSHPDHDQLLRRAQLTLEGAHPRLVAPLRLLRFQPSSAPSRNKVSRPELRREGARVASAKHTPAGGEIRFHGAGLGGGSLSSLHPRLIEHELAHLAGSSYGPPDWREWGAARSADRDHQLRSARPLGLSRRTGRIQQEFRWGSEWVNAYAGVFEAPRARVWEDWAESVALFFEQARRGEISRERDAAGRDHRASFSDCFPNRERLIREWLVSQ